MHATRRVFIGIAALGLGLIQTAQAAPTRALRIVGSGEFFRNGTANSTLGIRAHLSDDGAGGSVSLHTSRRARLRDPVPAGQGNITHFDTEFRVDCLLEVAQGDPDVLEVLIGGVKTARSQTSYVYRMTSDGQLYASAEPIATAGDRIFGRLRIDNASGRVERSDWTTGQEVCAGTSTSGLNAEAQALGIGVGDRTLNAFTECARPAVFLSEAIQSLVPDCDDPRVGSAGYELALDRALRPPNTVRFTR